MSTRAATPSNTKAYRNSVGPSKRSISTVHAAFGVHFLIATACTSCDAQRDPQLSTSAAQQAPKDSAPQTPESSIDALPTFAPSAAASPPNWAGTERALTEKLPPQAHKDLAGCWQSELAERWLFKVEAEQRMVVVREVMDPSYQDRARIPRPLKYQPGTGTYGFAAAGRIHALMFLFEFADGRLHAWSYSGRTPDNYAWTGNSFWLARCSP